MKDINRDSYDQIADWWDQVRSTRRVDFCIEEFCNLLPPKARILDIGCGTGKPVGRYCLDRGFEWVGIDVSEKMLQIAGRYVPDASLYRSDFFSFFDDRKFDGIIGFDSLWHIPYCEQHRIYPKAASLLKPGGYFLFTAGLVSGTVQGEMHEEKFRYAALDQSDVSRLLEENGLQVIRSEVHYEHPTTGTRDWLIVAKKCGLSND